ncbi:MAG TPA: S8 family peptidase [Pyrinomonadaceae bacterium]
MISIPGHLIEYILLGPLDDRRQLQDSPILGDVWVEFGKVPGEALDLLIAPYKGQHSGEVAAKIDDGVNRDANVAYLQGLIVANLTFEELARVVVPKTRWWISRWSKPVTETTKKPAKKKAGKKAGKATPELQEGHELHEYTRARVEKVVGDILSQAKEWNSRKSLRRLPDIPSLDRFVALTGLILWAGANEPVKNDPLAPTTEQIANILDQAEPKEIADRLVKLAESMLSDNTRDPIVWQVSLNRFAMPALTKSVGAVKADAASTLFKVNCSEITWAVLDSGIDGDHPAFKTSDGKKSRVTRAFDFKNFRRIVSLSNSKKVVRDQNVKILKADETWSTLVNPPEDPAADLEQLAKDAVKRGPIQWEIVSRFVEIKPDTRPSSNHGTHVAGIIGASKQGALAATGKVSDDDYADGMCPDIELFDFRVLGRDIKDTEFAIIAALQFIRHLNDRDNFLTIHGANLSLSIPHDVRNYACGRTPICDECERLIESGVVVVAAAGNHGYKSFSTKDGSYDSYAAFSITDPGNADSVITVGATHRFWPHTYGVSFFSSRGPTGDGRVKPDLVAPGEKIHAPFPNGEWGDLDGTSMAAPHVSGAAAMLMARYSELIQHPRQIKNILCESATDLGRERTFQGRGMLDVLRAFQSI